MDFIKKHFIAIILILQLGILIFLSCRHSNQISTNVKAGDIKFSMDTYNEYNIIGYDEIDNIKRDGTLIQKGN